MLSNPFFVKAFRIFLVCSVVDVIGCFLFISDYKTLGRSLMVTGMIGEVYAIYYFFTNRNGSRP